MPRKRCLGNAASDNICEIAVACVCVYMPACMCVFHLIFSRLDVKLRTQELDVKLCAPPNVLDGAPHQLRMGKAVTDHIARTSCLKCHSEFKAWRSASRTRAFRQVV